MYLTNESLIDLIMRHGYEVSKFGDTLAHLSYGNKHLTKRICTLALKEISKTDFERIGNYLHILESQLELDDVDKKAGTSLRKRRLEWIFGFPFMNTGL